MNVLIDARGLNYFKQTGVNLYTLHCLDSINELLKTNLGKQEQSQLKINLLGIKKQNIPLLAKRYPWFPFESKTINHISLYEYLTIPRIFRSVVSESMINFGLEVLLYSLPLPLFNFVFKQSIKKYDYVWLPVHKALPIHQHSKLILTLHDLFCIIEPSYLTWFQKIRDSKTNITKLSHNSYKILTPSYSTALDVRTYIGINENKIKVLYSGPILPHLCNKKPIPSSSYLSELDLRSKRYYVAISGIEARKNWFNIISAHYYNTLHTKNYNVWLYLAGIPVDLEYYNELKSFVQRESIPRVVFLESISEEDKSLLLRHSIALVYTSLYEGFGYPILEALATNTPVITSHISSMPEVARSAGVYVNPLDIVDIANAMILLSTDEEFRKTLIKTIPSIVSEFSWNEYKHFWKTLLTT